MLTLIAGNPTVVAIQAISKETGFEYQHPIKSVATGASPTSGLAALGRRDFRRQPSSLDRPILLSINGVWCYWCHEMDDEDLLRPATWPVSSTSASSPCGWTPTIGQTYQRPLQRGWLAYDFVPDPSRRVHCRRNLPAGRPVPGHARRGAAAPTPTASRSCMSRATTSFASAANTPPASSAGQEP